MTGNFHFGRFEEDAAVFKKGDNTPCDFDLWFRWIP